MDERAYVEAEALRLASKCRVKQSVEGDLEFELRKVGDNTALAAELRRLHALFNGPARADKQGFAHLAVRKLTDLLLEGRKDLNAPESVRVARAYLDVLEPQLPHYIDAYFSAMTNAFSVSRSADEVPSEPEEDLTGLRYFTVQSMVEFLRGTDRRDLDFRNEANSVRRYYMRLAPLPLRRLGPEELKRGRQGNKLPIRNDSDAFWVGFFNARDLDGIDECKKFYNNRAKPVE